ncbi:SufB/SufD family protein [Tumebacillus permanentifrigoris]|uniref:Fe-S cluster assembly protein SufD n=1 Tax=Tumebacillus permanentifrigoris TaxID=378543 RepID=A0A316D2K5_9BACL|nr:SufD family Fe-S cluster assembly protein [Tumebacillus permanentifrigoris]PWK05031.1 Fe-S cluster assembly protein SufD [Tumebacillus permanentifrigoris]
MTTDAVGKQLVQSLTTQRQEPSWLRELRTVALEAYERLPESDGLDLRKRTAGPFLPQDPDRACPERWEIMTPFQQGEKGRKKAEVSRLVYANEVKTTHFLDAEVAENGVIFADLSLAVRVFPSLVKPYLGQAVRVERDKWVALSGAIWNTGVFVYVPKNVKARLPLQAWWQRTIGGGQMHPRLLIVAEAGSEVTVIAGEVSKLTEPGFSVFVGEVFAQPGAQVRLAFLQEHDAQMTRTALIRSKLARDAKVHVLVHERGSGVGQVDVVAALEGDRSEARLDGLVLGAGNLQLDLSLHAEHLGRHTGSRLRTRTVLTEQARVTCRAVAPCEKGAVGAHSTQEEQAILLSATAQVHPIPMQIGNEEGESSDHAVSVGALSQEQLFYLMARGLKEAQARKLLLKSFLSPMLEQTPMALSHEVLIEKWLDRKGGK